MKIDDRDNEPRSSPSSVEHSRILFLTRSTIRQPIRNRADALLGRVRTGRPREFRAGRDKIVHQILGYAHVRHVLGDQHRRTAEPFNRHDEPFLSVDLRE